MAAQIEPFAPADDAPTVDEYAARRDRLAAAIGVNGIAILAAPPERQRNNDVDYPYRAASDFRYLTGFTEPQAIAVIAPGFEEGDYLLFCRERNAAQEIWVGRRAGLEGATADFGADRALAVDAFDDWLPRLLDGGASLYTAFGAYPEFERRLLDGVAGLASQGRGRVPPARIESLDGLLHEMRLFKSPQEIDCMRRAAAISAAGHRAAMQAVRPGLKEYQLAAVIHYVFADAGCHWAYPSIVGSGENACVLHYIENAAAMADGELVLIDAGAEYEGYAGDITRTFPVGGRFTAAQRRVYDIVLAANQAAIAAAKPGVAANAPHQAALAVLVEGLIELGLVDGPLATALEDEAYREFFMHGTSHWLGMDVHDVGDYKQAGEWRALEAGMALTVEPGLYLRAGATGVSADYADIGIRIEDDIVITAEGCEVLTADVPKQAEAIERLIAAGQGL